MPTKKIASKVSATRSPISSKNPNSPSFPLYGRPILDAAARGNVAEMKQIRALATKQIAEIQAALTKLDARMKRG